MIPLSIMFQKEDDPVLWPDLNGKNIHFVEAPKLAVLDQGMSSGAPSVSIRLDLPNGEHAIVQTSAKLFVIAANMIKAKYPNLLED